MLYCKIVYLIILSLILSGCSTTRLIVIKKNDKPRDYVYTKKSIQKKDRHRFYVQTPYVLLSEKPFTYLEVLLQDIIIQKLIENDSAVANTRYKLDLKNRDHYRSAQKELRWAKKMKINYFVKSKVFIEEKKKYILFYKSRGEVFSSKDDLLFKTKSMPGSDYCIYELPYYSSLVSFQVDDLINNTILIKSSKHFDTFQSIPTNYEIILDKKSDQNKCVLQKENFNYHFYKDFEYYKVELTNQIINLLSLSLRNVGMDKINMKNNDIEFKHLQNMISNLANKENRNGKVKNKIKRPSKKKRKAKQKKVIKLESVEPKVVDQEKEKKVPVSIEEEKETKLQKVAPKEISQDISSDEEKLLKVLIEWRKKSLNK